MARRNSRHKTGGSASGGPPCPRLCGGCEKRCADDRPDVFGQRLCTQHFSDFFLVQRPCIEKESAAPRPHITSCRGTARRNTEEAAHTAREENAALCAHFQAEQRGFALFLELRKGVGGHGPTLRPILRAAAPLASQRCETGRRAQILRPCNPCFRLSRHAGTHHGGRRVDNRLFFNGIRLRHHPQAGVSVRARPDRLSGKGTQPCGGPQRTSFQD